jgi:hypothetical protein
VRVTFGDLLYAETPESERMYLGGVTLIEALALWRRESCEEFTGGRHPYMLTVENGTASVSCDVCQWNPLEQGDLHEFLYFGPVPVDMHIESIVYPGGPWGGTEYDVAVEATPR